MSVKRLLYWKPSQGSVVNSHTLNEMSECIKTCFSGVEKGTSKTTLEYYSSKRFGISLMEQPDKYYFVILDQKLVVEADSSILTIMDKLQLNESIAMFNFEGVQYRNGDFQWKLIKVLGRDDNLRGFLMEIEYLPLSSVKVSKQIFEDFIEMWQKELVKKSLPGEFMQAEPNFAEYELSDKYTWKHTAVQYVTALVQLIRLGPLKLFPSPQKAT